MGKFNLEKAVEKAKFVVQKRKLPQVKAQVVMNMDVSASARGLFQSGQMQEAFQRVLPVGILFDDNKEIDVFTFADGDSTFHVQPSATEANFEEYVKKHILQNRKVPLWGGTDYAPVIRDNLESLGFIKEETTEVKKGWFGSTTKKTEKVMKSTSDSGHPSIVYFFTDGENSDQRETVRLLEECQKANAQVYFLFIGIGPANFSFIRKLGDQFDNTGFLAIRDLNHINDDEIMEQLLPEELCTWLGAK